MQLNIQIIDVEVTKVKTYMQMTVTYSQTFKGAPKVSAKKLTDIYTTPELWKLLEAAKKGDTFDITYEKNGEFNEWKSAVVADGPPPATEEQPTTKGGFSPREFEQKRQVLIIRQSCLSSAVQITDSPGAAIDAAMAFERYVMGDTTNAVKTIADMESDIPF